MLSKFRIRVTAHNRRRFWFPTFATEPLQDTEQSLKGLHLLHMNTVTLSYSIGSSGLKLQQKGNALVYTGWNIQKQLYSFCNLKVNDVLNKALANATSEAQNATVKISIISHLSRVEQRTRTHEKKEVFYTFRVLLGGLNHEYGSGRCKCAWDFRC